MTVVVGKQGHALCKILLLRQSLFLCQLNFMEIMKLHKVVVKLAIFGILLDLEQ